MTAPSERSLPTSVRFGVDVHRTRNGYTLTLHREEGAFPVLAANGRRLMRWRRLDDALAYATEHFGVLSAIRLNLDD
ncbi:hypothetical protein M2650_15100 [Luteimonas sp. SX5]|uniref:Transposase n=1 Tax=Luteimonas galliterrae TaxID=2940486 RepID=A0ABT0MM40_9GAMM|nr:hypothetical protein [Luteimonas galliterrae]MCL1635949.1 hypothetical protein [Luteimonas galliterrae]